MKRNINSLFILGLALAKLLTIILFNKNDKTKLIQSGGDLRKAFEKVGGVYVKFGQMMAMRRDIFPEEVCNELMQLLDKVPEFPFEKVKEVIKRDFGKELEEIFLEFENIPMASASLGQVYKAKLRTGEKVAVKILRPGIRETAVDDVKMLVNIARCIDFIPFINLKIYPLAKEFLDWLKDEVDYSKEVRNLIEFAEYETDIIPIFNIPLKTRLPKIYQDYCSMDVITMEFIEGITINKLIEASKDKNSKEWKTFLEQGYDVEIILREVAMYSQNQILLDGYFNADMHPANIMVNSNNEIFYIDFGLVGKLDPETRISLRRLVRSLAFLDKETGFDAFCTVMDIKKVKDIEWLKISFYKMIDEMRLARNSTTDYRKQASDALYKLFGLLYKMKVQVPPEVAKAYRTIVTADGIVHALMPEASMKKVTQDLMRVMLAATYVEIKQKMNKENINLMLLKAIGIIEKELLI